MKINQQLKVHKPEFTGLCTYFTIILLFFTWISFSGCTEPEVVIPDTKDAKDTVAIDTSGVIVFKPEDVPDYAKFYKPNEFKNMDMLRSDSKWSLVRSKQSDHFIVLWEEGFGLDPNAQSVPSELRVDIDDLLKKAEQYFDLNVNTLKFADMSKSNLSKYKMQIYMLYQTEWAAYGGGIDDVIGGLWINPATCKPVGSTIAHEIGHSFQYQVYADLMAAGECPHDFSRGFRYGFGGNGGNVYWEQTAQWQSYQSYPNQAFQTYNFIVYSENYNRHICHEWQRYASYFINYYWAEKHGIDVIGKLWREAVKPEDPIQAYMRIFNLTVEQLNEELYEAATRFVTWDLNNIREIGKDYIGKHSFKFYELNDGSYQVAYSKCPGSTGYNVVPLNVPDVGAEVKVAFSALTPGSALAPGDPGQYSDDGTVKTTTKYNNSSLARAGWRYGFVALLENGQRIYGDMNRKTSNEVSFVVPQNCARLWFVVTGAPSSYVEHAWDEKESNDDQWPYKLSFTNTDLLGNITINPNDQPTDLTLRYNVSFAPNSTAYTGSIVNLNANGDIVKVAQALVMQPSAIAGAMLNAKATPQEGKIAFAAVEPSGDFNYNTTANGHGFWFDSSGKVINWGSENDSKIFAEFNVNNMEFSIGQYPGKSKTGDKYTVSEALVYTKNGNHFKVTFVFNITIQ